MEELQARRKPYTGLRCDSWVPSWELPSTVNQVEELSCMFKAQSGPKITEVPATIT